MGQYWSLILCPVHWCSAQHFDGWEFHAYFMPVLTGQGIGDTGLCWGNACARAQVTGRVNVDNRDCVVEKSKASVQFQASTVSTIFHLSCHRYNVDLLIWYDIAHRENFVPLYMDLCWGYSGDFLKEHLGTRNAKMSHERNEQTFVEWVGGKLCLLLPAMCQRAEWGDGHINVPLLKTHTPLAVGREGVSGCTKHSGHTSIFLQYAAGHPEQKTHRQRQR